MKREVTVEQEGRDGCGRRDGCKGLMAAEERRGKLAEAGERREEI